MPRRHGLETEYVNPYERELNPAPLRADPI
jgi:hypothetical protein